VFPIPFLAQILEPGKPARQVAEHAQREVRPSVAVEISELGLHRARELLKDHLACAKALTHPRKEEQFRPVHLGGKERSDAGHIEAAVGFDEVHRHVLRLESAYEPAAGVEDEECLLLVVPHKDLAARRADPHECSRRVRRAETGGLGAEAWQAEFDGRARLLRERLLRSLGQVVAFDGWPPFHRDERPVVIFWRDQLSSGELLKWACHARH
jgi:hypothetical protein